MTSLWFFTAVFFVYYFTLYVVTVSKKRSNSTGLSFQSYLVKTSLPSCFIWQVYNFHQNQMNKSLQEWYNALLPLHPLEIGHLLHLYDMGWDYRLSTEKPWNVQIDIGISTKFSFRKSKLFQTRIVSKEKKSV